MLLFKILKSKIILFFLNIFDFFHKKKIFLFIKKNKLENINIFFDVGAHKGETIISFIKNLNIKNIYAFEASEKNFLALKRNIQFNNVILENIALGPEGKEIEFNYCKESSSSTLSKINYNSLYLKKKMKILEMNKDNFFLSKKIKTQSLKKYILEKNIDLIDFIKIDTEGYEYNVLKSLDECINNVKVILFEHHYDDMIIKNYTFSDINSYLLNKNFKKIFKIKMPFRKSFEYIYLNKNFIN